ncbi:MAG: hypothetical protein RLZZ558_557 [Planctomycetota bacterium]
MREMPTFHVMDRRLPVGIPLFASWWWRIMAVGASLGLLPVLAVMWSFIDAPFGRFMEWIWPTWLVRLGDLGSPTLWLAGGASVYLLAASLRHRAAARWSFLMIASVATALVVSGVFGGMLWTGRAWHAAGDAPDWNALWPDARCAAIAAAAFTLWVRLQGFGRVLLALVGLVMAAEVAAGSAFLSDAMAGAWIGAVSAAAVGWAWWRFLPETWPPLTPSRESEAWPATSPAPGR